LKGYYQAMIQQQQQQFTTPPGTILTTGRAAPSRSVLGGSGALRVVGLRDMRTSGAPLLGTVIGGTLIAPCFRLINNRTGALNAVFKAEDGGVSKLFIYNLSEAAEAQLTPGRAVVVRNVWYKRLRDTWPGIRVDNPDDLILDRRAEEVVAMARSGGAAGSSGHAGAAGEREDPMRAAAAAKEAGTQHFRAGRHAGAMEAYSTAIAVLFKDDEVPIVDFGLAEVEEDQPPPALRSNDAEAVPLAVTLLTNRAAAALKLNRPVRALADTRAALAFDVPAEQRAKVVYRRAQALMKVGAFDAARTVIEPFMATMDDHKALAQRANEVAAGIINNLPMADGQSLGGDGAFLGPIAMRRLGGRKGRGWVAIKSLEPGTLPLVEPALVSAPRTAADYDFSLQTKVLNCVGRDGDDRHALLDSLACMHSLLGEAEDTAKVRDHIIVPGRRVTHSRPERFARALLALTTTRIIN
jgi:hypothetical protein